MGNATTYLTLDNHTQEHATALITVRESHSKPATYKATVEPGGDAIIQVHRSSIGESRAIHSTAQGYCLYLRTYMHACM